MTGGANDWIEPEAAKLAESEELDDLVFACLERMELEGDAAIESLCREHPTHASVLRTRIGALREAGLIESPSIAAGGSIENEPFPESLGDFRLLERLGGGGMGVVYLAEQTSLHRRVALKLIRPEQLYFPGARARFEREVAAVARLAHPNIVQVYTVGEERGIPYFAMEEVVGASLADILRDQRGKDPARLAGSDMRAAVERIARVPCEASGAPRLFDGSWSDACLRIVRLVADALEHAHRRGVLHRDVKPSNVMITPAGRVLLLDFGLATMQGTSRLTRTGSQLGSLPYMSPEQAAGSDADVGVAADVYSLGVTLYEMLALRLPFSDPSGDRLRTKILEGRPSPPRGFNRALTPDAATVCLTAMDVDPARRYLTADAFARDLSNVLERRPIDARPVGPIVRARHWAERHPGGAAACAVVLLALTVGPLVFALQERGARRKIQEQKDIADASRVRAEANFRRALDAVGVLTRVGEEDLQGVPQAEGARRSLLESALRFNQEFLAAEGDRPELAYETACAELRVGDIDAELGRHDQAEVALRGALARFEDIERGQRAPELDARVLELRIAETHGRLGNVLKQRSELSQAEPEFLAAENAMSKLARDSGGGAAERFRLAEMREQRADVVRLRGDLERAEPMIRETQAAFADLARGEPEDSRYGVRHARSLLLLGDLYREEHRDAAAKSAHEECISRLEALLARPTHDERCRELLATAEGALAHDLYMLKELAQSAEHGEESLRLLRELIADHPQVARLYDQYFLTADNLSVAYGESKQPERGLAVLEEGIARLKRASETLPDRANVRRTLALAETNACSLLTQLDHSDEAYERLSRVIPSMRDELRATPEDRRLRSMVVVTTLNLADLSMDRGRHAEAATLLREMPQPTSASELVHAAGQLAYCRQLALEDKVASEAERAAAVKAYEAGLLAFLDHAIEQGLADPGPLESNKDFDAVRAMPEFQARLARVRQRAKAK